VSEIANKNDWTQNQNESFLFQLRKNFAIDLALAHVMPIMHPVKNNKQQNRNKLNSPLPFPPPPPPPTGFFPCRLLEEFTCGMEDMLWLSVTERRSSSELATEFVSDIDSCEEGNERISLMWSRNE
jgi:hypothetical protein